MQTKAYAADTSPLPKPCEVQGALRLLFISGQAPENENQHVTPHYPSQYRLA